MANKTKYYLLIAAGIVLTAVSCKKWLPKDLDYLSPQAVYTQTEFYPYLGRTTEYARIFSTDNSNTPIHFEITNVRYKRTNKPTNDLDKEVPVLVWKKGYTGYEKSLEEINAKRELENHHLWEVRETSGDFIFWASADSTMVRQQPDSGYLFDVVASNSGGSRTFHDLVLDPYRNIPYEPNVIDPLTGQQERLYLSPFDSSLFQLQYIHPQAYGMTGDSTDLVLRGDSIRVFFTKTGNGNSLTFKFLDKDSIPINPAKFNRTIWDSVVHGFNVKVTDTYVRYDVAYPIPLVKYRTRYTNSNGSQASATFTYNRIGFGGIRQTCSLNLNFAIYQKGDWEIAFYFYSDNPKFRNE